MKHNKKIILLFASLFILISISMISVSAKSSSYFTVNNVKYKILSDSTVAVWDASNVSGNYIIPSSVKFNDKKYTVSEIGGGAFCNNDKLISVEMPESITKIQDGYCEDWEYYGAFKNCSSLKSVKLSKNLKYIGEFSFLNDEALKNIKLPEKIEKIMNAAFDGTGISEIVIPKSTTYVGQGAFNRTMIEEIYIPKTCIEFHGMALGDTELLRKIIVESGHPYLKSKNGILYSKDLSFLMTYPMGKTDAEFEFLPETTGIEWCVFAKNKYLKKIILNETISEKGFGFALFQNSNVEEFVVPKNNPYLKSVDGVLFSKNGDSLILYPPAKKDKIYFIPSGTKGFSEYRYAFETCKYLEEVYVPASVKNCDIVFWNSVSLKQVVFSADSEIKFFSGAIFQNCENLESVCCPPKLENISRGGMEFQCCTNLKILYVPKNAPAYSQITDDFQTFIGCGELTLYTEGKSDSLSELAEKYDVKYKDVSKGSDIVLGLTFDDTVKTVSEGKSTSLNTVIYPEIKRDEKLSFKSSNNSVATVDESGKVTGVSSGKCYITVSSEDGAYARCQIIVKHISDNNPVIKAATCTANGTKTYKCAVCKAEFKTETIKATGHKETTLKGVKATAKKTGLTEGKKCSVCGKITVTQKMTLAQVTGLKSGSEKTTSLKLSWSKIAGAKYYKVEQSTDGKTWKTVTTTDKTSYTVKSLKAGTKYQFRVKALDSTKKTAGKASSVLKTGTLTSAPTVTLKSSKSKTAVASWKKVTGAAKYVVYKSADGKKWTKVTTTAKTSYTRTKLTGGKKVYIKVSAVNAYGKNSAESKIVNVTVKK